MRATGTDPPHAPFTLTCQNPTMKPDNRKPSKPAKPAAAPGTLATIPPTPDALDALTPQMILAQVGLIQQLLSLTMKEGEHFGTIPGCGPRPVLLKPGAEKLCLTFRLAPSYEVEERDHPGGHREYRLTCSLSSILSGAFLGQGVGICSTMEAKYRYRTGEGEPTDKPVPRAYWDVRADDPAKAQELIGGKGYSVKKVDGKGWMICKGGGKVEHDNPADQLNTVLKMAKKRALVDAVLTATAASDLFTQDLEDIAANMASLPPDLDRSEKPAIPAPEPARPAPETPPLARESQTTSQRPETANPPVSAHPVAETQAQLDILPASPDIESPAGWRAIRVHFGKNRGVALADLKPAAVKWYFDDWMPKNEAAGQQGKEDRSLCAALREWNRCGVLLNAIGVKCDGKGFREKDVADHVRQQAGFQMQTLPELPEATLRMILDNFDAIALEIVSPAA